MTSRCRVRAVVCVAVLAGAGVAGRGEDGGGDRRRPERVKGQTGPALIASGKAYFLHAVPLRSDQPHRGVNTLATPERGYGQHNSTVLLHTARPTGRMTVLFRTGTRTWFSDRTRVQRWGVSVTRLLGLACDGKYVYSLIGTWSTSQPGSRRAAVCSLSVWDVQTGRLIGSTRFARQAPGLKTTRPVVTSLAPAAPVVDVTAAGPLKITRTGLTCQNYLFTVKAGKLAWKALAPDSK